MKGFDVYRSSAGSGKTYTLVRTYLSLLFSIKSDYGFKQILAITFTNKAAEEMKSRVFDALEEIVYEGVANKIAQELAVEVDEDVQHVVNRAKSIFSKILHNYSDFNLLTIDKFTNLIIKAFSKELGILNSYEIILEEGEFLEEVVSIFIDESTENSQWMKMIEEMIDQMIALGSRNDLEKQLNKLQKIILQFDLSNQKPSHNHSDFLASRKQLSDKTKSFQNRLKKTCNKGLELIEHNQIDLKWSNRNRVGGILLSSNKIYDLTIEHVVKWRKWRDDGNWFKKSISLEQKDAVNSILDELLVIIDDLIENSSKYLKSLEILKNLTVFSLVHSLITKVIQEKSKRNAVLISEFNSLISEIILNEPAGFIFERIGNKFRHILIDEFQDTSTLQWNNLVPLVHESLSFGGKNLVVGDPKQAIYRWRNGDVKQFLALPNLLNENLKADYQNLLKDSHNEYILENNWRSSRSVVEFNNWLFKKLSENLGSAEIVGAFSDHQQKVKREIEGNMHFLIKDKKQFDLNIYLKQKIQQILSQEYKLSDITILVRGKNDSSKIVKALQKIGIPFVSDDSLFLAYSDSYRMICHCLNYFEYKLERDRLILQEILKKQVGTYQSILLNVDSIDMDLYYKQNVFDKIKYCMTVLSIDIQDPYVDVFLDVSIKKIEEEDYLMEDLLAYFRDYSNVLTVDNGVYDAIKILTIHKSKGLEFPIVIIPFGDWPNRNNKDSSYVWIGDTGVDDWEISNFIGELTKKSMYALGKDSIYEEESNSSILDNMNLYYVAFTRACDELHVAINDFSNSVSVSSKVVKCIKEHINYNEDLNELIVGDLHNKISIDKQETKTSLVLNCNFSFNPSSSFIDKSSLISNNSFGKLFHDVISKVYSDFSIGYNYLNYIENSCLYPKEWCERCRDYMNKLNEFDNVNPFFSKNLLIYNEREISNKKGEVFRVDKLIIKKDEIWILDYKTGEEKEEDVSQIQNYMEILSNDGFSKVRGYLLYLIDCRLKEVNHLI